MFVRLSDDIQCWLCAHIHVPLLEIFKHQYLINTQNGLYLMPSKISHSDQVLLAFLASLSDDHYIYYRGQL